MKAKNSKDVKAARTASPEKGDAAHEFSVGKTTEDYLEAILMIRERQGYVRSIDVAEQMGVTKPSVTYTTKRLKEAGYLTSDHAGMLVLTDSGMEIADRTYTRHRTLARLLMNLGVSEKQALTDACLMEHDVSQETFEALCTLADSTSKSGGKAEKHGKKK